MAKKFGGTDTGGNEGPLPNGDNFDDGLGINNLFRDEYIPDARDYQQKAIDHMMGFGNAWLEACVSLDENHKTILNNALRKELQLEMATGSGKTYTVANIINTFFYARENLIKKLKLENNHDIAEKLEKTPVRILVLSHQIAITDQHKKVFMDGEMDGERWKKPLLCNDLRNNCRVSVYHSKVKNVTMKSADGDDLDQIEMETGEDIVKNFAEQYGKGEHEVVFTTHQTAARCIDRKGWTYVVVDESHHAEDIESDYGKFKNSLKIIDPETGLLPMILNLSATPTKEFKDKVGKDNMFIYSLAEYIASEFCPDIEYNAVGLGNMDIEIIQKRIRSALLNRSEKEKKEALKKIKEELTERQKLFDIDTKKGNDQDVKMIDDLDERLKNIGSRMEKTIVFAKSIKEANIISNYINRKYNNGEEGYAEAMHSDGKTSKPGTLDRYASGETKVIVAVDQLNEAIDLPETKHVVFARGTDSQTIFLQQLGRALRGNGTVYIWDYVTSFTNMEQINFINSEIEALTGKGTLSSGSKIPGTKKVKVFEGEVDGMRREVFEAGTGMNEAGSNFGKIALLREMVGLVNGKSIADRLIEEFKNSVSHSEKDPNVKLQEGQIVLKLMKRGPKKISENEFIGGIVSNRPNLLTIKGKISPFNMYESRCRGKLGKSDDDLIKQFLLEKCSIDKKGSEAWFAILALIYPAEIIQSIKSRINRVDDSLDIVTIEQPGLIELEPDGNTELGPEENPKAPPPELEPEKQIIPDGRSVLEGAGIGVRKLEGMILPPDPEAKLDFLSKLSRGRTTSEAEFNESIEGFVSIMEKEEKEGIHYDKVGLFINLIKEHKKIFQIIGEAREGELVANATRKVSYFVFDVKVKYKDNTEGIKTVLICNQYANATFIVDGEMSDFDLLTLYKKNLPNYEDIRISFTDPDLRKRFVTNTLKDKNTGHVDLENNDLEGDGETTTVYTENIDLDALKAYEKINYRTPTAGVIGELVRKIKKRVPEFNLSMIKFIPGNLNNEIRESDITNKPGDIHKLIEAAKELLGGNTPTIIDIIGLIYGYETVELIRRQGVLLIKDRIIQRTNMLDPIKGFKKLGSDRIKDIFKCPEAEGQYFYSIYGLSGVDVKNFGPKTSSKYYMKHKYKIFVALGLMDATYPSDYFYNPKYEEVALRQQIDEQMLGRNKKNPKKKVFKPSDYLFSGTLSERIHLFLGTLTLESEIIGDIVYYSGCGELKKGHTIQKDARIRFLTYIYGEDAIESYKFEKIEEMRNKLRDKLSTLPPDEPVKTIKELFFNLHFSPKTSDYIGNDILENVFLVEKDDIAIANKESRGERGEDSPTFARTQILNKMDINNNNFDSNYDFVYGSRLTSRLGVPIDQIYKNNPPHDGTRLSGVLGYMWRNKPELTLEMFSLKSKAEFIAYFKLSDPLAISGHDQDFTTLANFVKIPVNIGILNAEDIHRLLRGVYGEATYERLKRNMIEHMIKHKLGVDINTKLTKDMLRRFLVYHPRTWFPENESDYATYLRLFGFNVADLIRSNGQGRLDLLNLGFDLTYYGRQLKEFNDVEFEVNNGEGIIGSMSVSVLDKSFIDEYPENIRLIIFKIREKEQNLRLMMFRNIDRTGQDWLYDTNIVTTDNMITLFNYFGIKYSSIRTTINNEQWYTFMEKLYGSDTIERLKNKIIDILIDCIPERNGLKGQEFELYNTFSIPFSKWLPVNEKEKISILNVFKVTEGRWCLDGPSTVHKLEKLGLDIHKPVVESIKKSIMSKVNSELAKDFLSDTINETALKALISSALSRDFKHYFEIDKNLTIFDSLFGITKEDFSKANGNSDNAMQTRIAILQKIGFVVPNA